MIIFSVDLSSSVSHGYQNLHQETYKLAFDGISWLLMNLVAFKASKAIESHEAENHESQSSRLELEPSGTPTKAKFSHQKPIKSHLKAM